MDIKNIIKKVKDKNRIIRLCFMTFGVFLMALNYNVFFVKYNLVTGGVSGLSIVFSNLWGWNNEIFIYVANILLLILSFLMLGVNQTKKAIVGSILYPVMITLSKLIAPYLVFDNFIITLLFTAIIYGFANGLIYKMGYNTGGSDIIMKIMCKYLHMPEGRANLISSMVIILFAGIVLDINTVVYAIIITYIFSVIVDRMLIGISKSKLFIIDSIKSKEIEETIINDLHLGVTIIKAKGGYSNNNKELLMCAVPTNDYYLFREIILTIDKNAFFIITDSYEINGGTIKSKSFSLDDIL